MNCSCDYPARYIIGRDGKPCYICGLGQCRLYATAPMQCDGYHRVTLGAPGCPPADTGVVLRFEALVHPENAAETAFMIRVQGDPSRWAELRTEVLQDPKFQGRWYTTAKAFLYPMVQYKNLLAAVKTRAVPYITMEEIPAFYFRCVEGMRQVPVQHRNDVANGHDHDPDLQDCVFRQLKPFQKEGVQFVIEHQGRAMIADDMGLGKTVQAIAVAHHYRDEWPVLIVCPMSLMENWAKEFNRFCGIPYTRIAILQGAKAQATSLQDVVIVSYSSLKCVEQAHFKFVILDESHYIKAGAAKRAQQSLKLCRESHRVLLLSGTPAMSRPIELYAQLQAIKHTMIPSKNLFGARYCNSFVSRFGIDMTGHSHTEELHSLLRHYVIRRTKKELSSELPSKSRQLLYVYITDKEKKALEKQVIALRRSLAAATAGSSSGGVADLASRAPNAFEMKQATARAKVPAVQDYVSTIVEQHLDSGEKVILFAHHQTMMEALRAAVEGVRPRQPIDYIYISGDTPAAQREPAADHFRNEPTCSVAILSMQSSGTGHNFTCASTVVFTELDWSPSTHLQCEDRVHRIGQAQPCHIKYLLAEGTSDSVIWPLLQTKLTVTTALFDTTGGAAEARLQDGADKQQVSRRDMGSSPSLQPPQQQGTLDPFLSSSASALPSEDMSPVQRISVRLPLENRGNSTSTAASAAAPTSPWQSSEALGAADRTGKKDAQQTATVAPVLLPFSMMGNAYEDKRGPPPRRSAGATAAAATPSSPSSGEARGASATVNVPGNGHGGQKHSATASTSVLDMMRQTVTPTSSGVTAAEVVVVVDDPDVFVVTHPPPPRQVPSPALVQPTSPPRPVITLPVSPASPVLVSRRTVFTLGAPAPPVASPAAPPFPPPPAAEGLVRQASETAPVVVHVPRAAPMEEQTTTATAPVAVPLLSPAPNTVDRAGCVRVPLRFHAHLKRTRAEADGSPGVEVTAPDSHPEDAVPRSIVRSTNSFSPLSIVASSSMPLYPPSSPQQISPPAHSSPPMEGASAEVVGRWLAPTSTAATAAEAPRRTVFQLVRRVAPRPASQ